MKLTELLTPKEASQALGIERNPFGMEFRPS